MNSTVARQLAAPSRHSRCCCCCCKPG
jgi:hypothetical protein